MNNIPYGRQQITDEDIDAVIAALRSDYLTQGPLISEFERAFAQFVECRYAVAVANGTAALHLSALALGVQPGQKIITTPITFAASANCVRYCGGDVVFADIDPETYLIDIKNVKKLLEKAPKGAYAGIIPVDLAGRAVNLEDFRELANEHGLWIIEDACHSPGGYFIDRKGKRQLCGNGKYAELAVFSFHPVKHIACGEGGMITTNDENLYKKVLLLRSHGITRDQNSFFNEQAMAYGSDDQRNSFPGWYMEMQELGFNYRLTDFQAALGISQLSRAGEGLNRRRQIAETYFKAFQNSTFVKGQSGAVDGHAYHLYIAQVENRLGLYDYLRTNNIFAQIHYIPLHLMPYYRQFGWKGGDFPVAEGYYKSCISLPMYPALQAEEQQYVIETIKSFYHA
jgi:UDP-4-amino-4,6-dideoxy-N-acetyl-beta-L-altrosamine transaminase